MEDDYRVYELRDPTYWGPIFWKFLYLSAMGLPYSLTNKHKEKYEDLIKNFAVYLPCAECRYHYTEMLKKRTFSFETREDILFSILEIHNSVRLRQRKKEFTYENVMSFHHNEMKWGQTNNQMILQ